MRALSPSNNIRITLSHFVEDKDEANFKRLITILLADRKPITPDELFRHYVDGEPIQGKLLVLTFDDGLLSSFTATQKILNPLGLKAMFFIPTKILSLKTEDAMRAFFTANVYRKPWTALPRERYMTMTAAHVQELHAQGHMVLPHTHTHVELSKLNTAALVERELRMPKVMLEDLLQAPAEGFAFPIGNERVVGSFPYEQVKDLYSSCFTGLNGLNFQDTDRFFLHRDCVHPYYSAQHVSNISAGSYDLYYAFRMRRLRRRVGA